MKSLFSQPVSVVAVFSRIYSHLKNISGYIKFYLASYVWRYVIWRRSIPECIRWELMNWKCSYWTLFSIWFSPLGASAASLMIQKFSRRFSRSLSVSLFTFDISVNCSIRVNFAYSMKLWQCILKWLHTGIAFGLVSSFLWLFTFKVEEVLDFSTY